LDIFIRGIGDQIAEVDVAKNARPAAADGSAAGECHHRDAHPQTVERCRVAGIWNRIEARIHPLVQLEIFLVAHQADEFDAIGGEALIRHLP